MHIALDAKPNVWRRRHHFRCWRKVSKVRFGNACVSGRQMVNAAARHFGTGGASDGQGHDSRMMMSAWRFAREMGLNPKRFVLIASIRRYWRDLRSWRSAGGTVSTLYPVLSDWHDSAGDSSSAYFHQDLLVARFIFQARPQRHLDVGSRIDGFVAHVSVFRQIDVIDIRPMPSSIANVNFVQADLMRDLPQLESSTDSLSCLHALEHFGLGRYGDPIDPIGHIRGFRSLVKMLKPNAMFYLSFPVGQPRVEFNAHRIFSCTDVFAWPDCELLELKRFDFVDDKGSLHSDVPFDEMQARCAQARYGCGIYSFMRKPVTT